MTSTRTYRTERLVLRGWRAEDLPEFARMNADPAVMEHFPATLTRAESDAMATRVQAHMDARGFGLWAVEVTGGAAFAGFVGLQVPSFEAPFMPCVEIGWRLSREHQGQGYATEAAHEVLRIGFEEHGLAEIVSMTVPRNRASRRVMEKLGLVHRDDEDFDHPRLPEGHPLRRHVLYRLPREAWRSRHARAPGAGGEKPFR